MGAWGEGPLASDQALDWLYRPANDCAQHIRDLLDTRFDDPIGHEMELRAACHLLMVMGRFMSSHDDDLPKTMAETLQKIVDTQGALDSWNDPNIVRSNIVNEIAALKKEFERSF